MAFTVKNFFKQLWKDSTRTSCHYSHRWHEGLHHEYGFDVNVKELAAADLNRFHKERKEAEKQLSDPANSGHVVVEPPKSYHIKKQGSAKYRGWNIIHVGHLIPMGIRQGVNGVIDFIDYHRPAKNFLPLLCKGVMHVLGLGFNILSGFSTFLKWSFHFLGLGCSILGGPLRPLGKLFDGLSVAFDYCSKACNKAASTLHSAGKYFNQFLSTKRTVMAHDKIIYPSTGPVFTFVKGAVNFLFGVFVQFPLYLICSKALGDQTIDKAIDCCSGTKVEIVELAGTDFLAETLLKRKTKNGHKKQQSRCDIDAILKSKSNAQMEMVPLSPRPLQPDEKDQVVAVEIKNPEPSAPKLKRAQTAFIKSPRPAITVQATTRHKRTRTVGKKDSHIDSKSQSSSGNKMGSNSGEMKAGSSSGANVVHRIDLTKVKQGSHSGGIASRLSNSGTPHSGKPKPPSDSGPAADNNKKRPPRMSVVHKPGTPRSPGSPARGYNALNRPPVKLFDGSITPPANPGAVNQENSPKLSGVELVTRQASA